MFQVFFSAWLSRVLTVFSQYKQDFLKLSSILIMLSMFCDSKSEIVTLKLKRLANTVLYRFY